MPKLNQLLLLEPLEEHEFLISSPSLIEERIVQFIDDVVVLRELIMVGKATHAEVTLLSKHLRRLADVPAAVVALYFIGGVDDVLGEGGDT